MNERIYRELESGVWAQANPAKCPCRGGWLLSDYDTWHRCPLHGKGVPHPDDEEEGFDSHHHNITMLRDIYAAFRDQAHRMGFRGNFRLAANPDQAFKTPQEWVNAAEKVVETLQMSH